jgi:hypothetical protein
VYIKESKDNSDSYTLGYLKKQNNCKGSTPVLKWLRLVYRDGKCFETVECLVCISSEDLKTNTWVECWFSQKQALKYAGWPYAIQLL